MDANLAREIYERDQANLINRNPIEQASEITIKVVALNEQGGIVLTRFFQELAQRHESTRKALFRFNEFQLSPSSEFNKNGLENETRKLPQPPKSRNLDDWLIYRLEMMPFGVNIKIPEIAKKLPYDYESARKRNQNLCRELRKKYGLENFETSL